MNKKALTSGIIASYVALCGLTNASASPVTLTFNRTGADAASVSVSVSGATGATAKLEAVSPAMKTSGSNITSSILCPDVNGNTSPTINFRLTVSGLPSDYSFNTVGLDIHAFNAGGAYQNHNDNKARQWNVDVATGANASSLNSFAYLSDIDIAAGVNPSGDCHQIWNATSATNFTGSNVVIDLTITKGSTNEGCFFGLSSVVLGEEEGGEPGPVDPIDPPVVGNGKYYTIKWKNNTTSYMCEDADGGIVINGYSTSSKIFWELIPTDNEDCYYIRNTASGLYIGTCNMSPSSASKVKMSVTPVEYYVHLSASTSGENKGCWWLSSTDCTNYNQETSGARCLNKDGASSSIITWTTGLTNYGSYWTLTETENLYEDRPFTPVAAIGQASGFYMIGNGNKALNHDMQWVAKSQADNLRWYFVGESNIAGGYQIVNGMTDTPINSGTRYKVQRSENGYTFVDEQGSSLSIGGISDFSFTAMRTSFALAAQIYNMPCGNVGNHWITKIEGPNAYRYPYATAGTNGITNPTASKPTNKYTIVSRDRLYVTPTASEIKLTLNKEPDASATVSVHYDYDCDGVFEVSEVLTPSREITYNVKYNEEVFGTTSRIRIRISDNQVTDPEADIQGQIIDLVANYLPDAECGYCATVDVNDKTRGTATLNENDGVATATPKGTSLFLYWKQDHRLLYDQATVQLNYNPVPYTLTAYFSPNLEVDGIDESVLGLVDGKARVIVSGRTAHVCAESAVSYIYVFGLNGAIATSNSGSTSISLDGLANGVYLIKAITADGVATEKIII